ncbi:RluA family pseudouridine synthase [Rossellomorea marisflavi]|uniref:Pseudouridine synthase n=1 Tax=Rossellomorea marisflavi TaxID=189381 RepID=A0A0J5TFT4_9BACI|nr:RluA family pseudouridine synthase [Rossellomorea marisflavi]KMK96927.1 pseudouridine synthase [Rossellomorea marisflavi]KML06028.1 pseudouridine synthase [Rossellomorea marisflavi]KML33084.1 pseudouridine synthase [Rossellomorea marisflavi]KZE43739.1 RNA pseudouridine synthase [Rossellomorea marisflavi]TYO71889.1 RluA family pseudouridine synthase [Rossellomorea marisflavi]
MKTRRIGDQFELTIPSNWKNVTIEMILKDKWNSPKKWIHSMRMSKEVKINGEVAGWNEPLKGGDRLQLPLFKGLELNVNPTYGELDVLYEDEHVIVVNKPAGIDTHPNGPDDTHTLANLVAFHIQASGKSSNVLHIHRLDKDTSGAVVFAKDPLSKAILDRLLSERKVKRTYHAVAQGSLKKNKGSITDPIGRDRHHPTRRRVSASGQEAITHFKVVSKQKDKTCLTLQLKTGRTHQIRVHLSSLGHPLAGDLLYDGTPVYKRQALHASSIVFPHPLTGETISCHASCSDIAELNWED